MGFATQTSKVILKPHFILKTREYILTDVSINWKQREYILEGVSMNWRFVSMYSQGREYDFCQFILTKREYILKLAFIFGVSV